MAKSMNAQKTVGEVLIHLLEQRDTEFVFGIPGVHTVELYRGLSNASIRHVTPRNEMTAGFMADGYARASGKPGICLLITGPGVTNAITAMGQARADSIPMMIISGVNEARTHGQEEGYLHELPDQIGLMRSIALYSETVHRGADLERIFDRAFTAMTAARPGPVHIEIPLDIMSELIEPPRVREAVSTRRMPDMATVDKIAAILSQAKQPLILAGGGAIKAEEPLRELADIMDAPIISTINARQMMRRHALHVPASPSLPCIRNALAKADVILAIGTQFSQTDYDMDVDGGGPNYQKLIRIDVDPIQASRGELPDMALIADADLALKAIIGQMNEEAKTRAGTRASTRHGHALAAELRKTAFASISETYQAHSQLVTTIGQTLPGCLIVGDSTQVVYAGNVYADLADATAWFNSSVGFGSLGYGAPAAIGASLAQPGNPVVCITGDGGFQFCLSELGTAADENVPVIFIVWNNAGYQEIENYMIGAEIETIGVTPRAPDFVKVAEAYGIFGVRTNEPSDIPKLLNQAAATNAPFVIEVLTA